MGHPRLLVKIDGAPGAIPQVRLGARGTMAQVRPLAPRPTDPAAPPPAAQAGWHVVSVPPDAFAAVDVHPWDQAHAALRDGLGVAGATARFAEPDIEQSWDWHAPDVGAEHFAALAAQPCKPDGQAGGAYDTGSGFGWHLGDDFSGLRAARTAVGDKAGGITIVHLDTGFDPAHKALPPNLDLARQQNFIDGEDHRDASDRTPPGVLHNPGHGTGTIGILGGGDASVLQSDPPPPPGFGAIGGAPGAKIVPVRIANSVVHFWTSSVALGIHYARLIGADVVSMSMGGLASDAWADAVNLAYETGIVLVTAAGNNFAGLPTSLIVYPARFQRVIAACGIMARGHPYNSLGGPMEGNVGPASKMATAMAAYTPNIPWLRLGCADVVDMDGNGTSSATPQIAAAAALWLAEHGNGLPRDWRRVEAVRAALFGTADPRDGTPARPSPVFGRGSLRAGAAIGVMPDLSSLRQTPADSAAFGFLHLLSSAFGAAGLPEGAADMLRLELTQLALRSRGAREAVPDPGLPPEQIMPQQQRRLLEAILDERQASRTLRLRLEAVLGRTQVVTHSDPDIGPGGGIRRRMVVVPPPASRRLRVFASDPGDSSRLETAFINLATLQVPWEALQPGPVGEYLEVIDVDPASDAVYDPVDLEHPFLLGQDGHAPSEGNPQFHQQMAYAIAARTIRNFEIALGRRVLWSERRMPRPTADAPFVPAPDGGYVQRLRVYPHAMRERNAYYDPQRKALLFGYFPDIPVNGQGNVRRTVFTCLSHDIVAHETTHAVLDGLHRHYQEDTNPDVLAFHEAFADIVAIFQHFTMPELLRYEIARLRGDLAQDSMLSDLARQFGDALHNGEALRRALDGRSAMRRRPGDGAAPAGGRAKPVLTTYSDTLEPHDRGAILVAAVFEAFLAIYARRTDDLMRLATGGTGVLRPGAIPPDLVARLADTAADTAQHILTLCMRAVDYMPPVDPTFGDFLRAVITAEADVPQTHGLGYRVAFAEAFNARGIYPPDITSVAPDALCWQPPDGAVQRTGIGDLIRTLDLDVYSRRDRRLVFQGAKSHAVSLHRWMSANLTPDLAAMMGLDFTIRRRDGQPRFEVLSVRPARRSTVDGEPRTDIVAIVTQHVEMPLDPGNPAAGTFTFRGGTTLLLNRDPDAEPVRFAISRPVSSGSRQARARQFQRAQRNFNGLYAAADAAPDGDAFAAMHRRLGEGG